MCFECAERGRLDREPSLVEGSKLRNQIVDECDDELFFVAEVVEERRLVDPDRLGDFSNAKAFETMCDQLLKSDIEDLGAPRRRREPNARGHASRQPSEAFP
ncbi:MAG TPA: hypothetical protein VGP41_13850, partial [Candidatus Lustribacter sp.]|nr:hypothetical protein [Candidatus Lustribacter sp.]